MTKTQVIDGERVEMTQEEIDEWNNLRTSTLSEVKSRKINEIEAERLRRNETMPFTTPDGIDIQIKIAEQPPAKPRQTWLAGASAKGLAAKVKGQSFTNDLIAADDSRHDMNEDEWIQLGEKLQDWIKAHIDAASQHIADIQSYNTVDEVQNHDLTKYWPQG